MWSASNPLIKDQSRGGRGGELNRKRTTAGRGRIAEDNKYIQRERRKELPKGFDFWDFDCRVGPSEALAKVVHVSALSGAIETVQQSGEASCYLEIVSKPTKRGSAA